MTLATDVRTGLTSQEAAARLEADGRNEVLVRRAPGIVSVVARQLTDTIIVVLLVAAVLTAVVGDFADMAVILAVVVINSSLGALQEVRSEQALAALAELTAPRATVVRDGAAIDIDAADVVVGDLLRLAAGDIVPADASVIAAEGLQLDESMLTGESVPVDRALGESVHAGTVVTRGRGGALVTAVSGATAIGEIANALQEDTDTRTPVQRQLAIVGRRLAMLVTVCAIVVGALNLIAGRGAETSLVLAISLAVAAIPESLPAVVSLSLAMAARRMAARGVLARRLSAVEALGSVTVIASDKTGTLTEGRMAVADMWLAPDSSVTATELLEAAVLCSDACNNAAGTPGERDDPTEIALVDAARDVGIDVAALRDRFARIDEIPFDATTKFMQTTHRAPSGDVVIMRKGSPEVLTTDWPAARAKADEFALKGLRVLAVTRAASGQTSLLGLLALADPPRLEAIGTISAFRAAGVRPVMITGDHPATARSIAEALELVRPGEPVSSGDPQGIDVRVVSVYARVSPSGKTAIVNSLQEHGELVAMTGDGVNDAPALRASDIGVAMGRRGTEVAKAAADLILTGDDLSAMVPAIAEGRRAFDNLRRFLHYGLSGGLAEVLLMLVGPFVGFPLPLQAGQILWVNLLTHGMPGVAMGGEPAAPDVLSRPPRSPGESLVDGRTAKHVAVLGSAIAVLCLLAGAWAKASDRPWQSTIFLSLAFAQLAVAMALRPRNRGGERNLWLPIAVVVNVALAWLAVQWHPLEELLRTQPMHLHDLGPCLVVAAFAALIAFLQTHPMPRR